MLEITRTFTFEAAHTQPGAAVGHPNARVHGHSFLAEVTLAGEPNAHGMVRDFGQFEAALEEARTALDHHFLNDVPGLMAPTLEGLALFIYGKLAAKLPELAAVTVRRPSLGQAASYRGG